MKSAHFLPVLLLTACSTTAHDINDSDVPSDTDAVEAWPVSAFGDASTAQMRVIADDDADLSQPMDLEFRPDDPSQLWVVNQATDSVTIVWDADTEEQWTEWRKDTFGNHFMEKVSSLAFGDATYKGELTFATCQESRNTYDDNYTANNFMGPALWPADLDVFAQVNQSPYGSLGGSHLDMLHGSPNCMGIAHDNGNAYWVFDGWNDELVYYDFQEDHGPGRDDHSDGIVRRYSEVTLERQRNTPGHMVLDKDTGWLYIANTKADTVLAVDTLSGEVVRDLGQLNEPLEEHSEIGGVTFIELTTEINAPAGIALDGEGNLLVGSSQSGEVYALDPATGEVIDVLATPAQKLGGLAIGPEGRLFYVDVDADEVHVVDPGA